MDLEIDINDEYWNEFKYDFEEKQSPPTSSCKRRQKESVLNNNNKNMQSAVTPSTLYHLTGNLNVNDLPIHIDESQKIKPKNSLSELFVGGGKQYWQNIKDTANVAETGFYATNSKLRALTSFFADDSDIDLSGIGLQIEAPTNSSQHLSSDNNTISPITPQPRQSQIARDLINKKNDNNNNNNKQQLLSHSDPYQITDDNKKQNGLSSSHKSCITDIEELEHDNDDNDDNDDDDDRKYGDYNGNNKILNGLPGSATTSGGKGVVVIPDNVPFGIAALFDSTIDPNPITSVSKYQHNQLYHHQEDEENNNNNNNNNNNKIENEKNNIHEIENDKKREEKDDDKVLVSMQSFKDDAHKLESIEDRYKKTTSFPLGKIDEDPQLELTDTVSPISPIHDIMDEKHAFGPFKNHHVVNNNDDKKDDDDNDDNKKNDDNDNNDDNKENHDEKDDKKSDDKTDNNNNVDIDIDDDDKRLNVDKESIISDLEMDEKKDLQSDDDNDSDINNDDNNNLYDDTININGDGGGGTHSNSRGNNKNRGELIGNRINEAVDLLQFKENGIRLKAARNEIDKLEQQIDCMMDENGRLQQTKMELLNKTSSEMESMRDELQNMCNQLQLKDERIRRLIDINCEGYASWSNPANGIITDSITDTKKSKIDLAISTSQEIERLRSIIRVLSRKQTLTYYPGGGTY